MQPPPTPQQEASLPPNLPQPQALPVIVPVASAASSGPCEFWGTAHSQAAAAAGSQPPANAPTSLLDEIRMTRPSTGLASLGESSFAVFQKQSIVTEPQQPSRPYGLSSGLIGTSTAQGGSSSISANNVDVTLFSLPLDIRAMEAAYVAVPVHGQPWVVEAKVEPFVGLASMPHELPIDRYERYCLSILTELQLRQPRSAPANLSVWFQASMRQTADRAELWNLPSYFRRIDTRLSIDLLETLRQDILLYAPLQKLSTKCLLAGIHVPARLVMTIIAQASSKPERLVQEALESRLASIQMRMPATVAHLSRFMNEVVEFSSECPPGVVQTHKLEEKVLTQVALCTPLAADLVMYKRQPWHNRSWTQLIEAVRHFEVEERSDTVLAREMKAFQKAEARRNTQGQPTPRQPKAGAPAGLLSALPAPVLDPPPEKKEKKKRQSKTQTGYRGRSRTLGSIGSSGDRNTGDRQAQS